MSMLSKLIARACEWLDESDESKYHHIVFCEPSDLTNGNYLFLLSSSWGQIVYQEQIDEINQEAKTIAIPAEKVVVLCLTNDVPQFCELLGYPQ